jgi:Zn-dependent protease/CBS domain-containing protein
MFGQALTLFTAFGVRVKVDLSWALIALLIAWTLAQGAFPQLYGGFPAITYWWMAVVAVAGLAASIILHELAHSVVAKAFGMPIRSITLFIFGGVAELEEEPATPQSEFLMAIAGPLMSVALSGAFALLSGAAAAAEPLSAVFAYLSLLNIVLAVFNMIPAFPMDGGRALRAAVWGFTGDFARATRAAAAAGQGFGWVLMGLGALFALSGQLIGGLWWVLIGAFVQGAARSSLLRLHARAAFAGRTVERFMTPDPDVVPADLGLRAFLDEHVYARHHDFFPVVADGRLVGAVGRSEIKAAPHERWDELTVGDIMVPVGADNAIAPDADAGEALARMQARGASRLLVVDGGRLVGVIALKDLLEVVALRMDLEP